MNCPINEIWKNCWGWLSYKVKSNQHLPEWNDIPIAILSTKNSLYFLVNGDRSSSANCLGDIMGNLMWDITSTTNCSMWASKCSSSSCVNFSFWISNHWTTQLERKKCIVRLPKCFSYVRNLKWAKRKIKHNLISRIKIWIYLWSLGIYSLGRAQNKTWEGDGAGRKLKVPSRHLLSAIKETPWKTVTLEEFPQVISSFLRITAISF